MDEEKMFLNGITFGGHPVACAAALANLDVFDKEKVLENVRQNEAFFRSELEKLYELPIVGDIRGAGYFYGIELVKDRATKESFTEDEAEEILFKYVSPKLYEAGLICRADDRGELVVRLSPPLVAGREIISEIAEILYRVLKEASGRVLNA